MKGLITLVMKGRMQAIAATVVCAVLGLLITPLSLLSVGLVVLATLRNGPREGLLVVVSASLAMLGLGGLLFQMPIGLALLGLLLWLPAWGLAYVLGRTSSLARSLEFAAYGGLLLVALQYLLLNDPVQYWQAVLTQHLTMPDATAANQQQLKQLIATLAGWMPGAVASSWMLSMSLGLLLGRWWQSLLDSPGAFGEEYRELRFSRVWLILLPLLLVPTFLVYQGESSAIGQLYLVGVALFLLQGLSVAHALVKLSGASKGWLIGLYIVLFVGAPYSFTALAAGGYADGWLNFRARVRAR